LLIAALFLAVAISRITHAAPELINYQGKLMDSGGTPLSGTYSITFRIYNQQTGGTALWNETHSSVQVQDGTFNILLGSVSPFPATLFDSDTRWLALKVGSDPEMTPRSRITSVAYAIQAEKATEAATATYAATAGSAPADNDWDVNGGNVYIPSGSVGIGTDTPTSPLHVYNNTGETNVTIESNGGNAKLDIDGADTHVNFERYGSYRGAVGYRTAGDYLYLHQGGYVVVKDGKLGVGETDPQAMLDVYGDVRVSNKIIPRPESDSLELTDNDGNTRVEIRDDGVEIADDSDNPRLKVINNGNVGIGTTSPEDLLHVKKLSGSYDAKIETDWGDVDLVLDSTSGNSSVEYHRNGIQVGTVGYDHTNHYIYLYENGKVVMDDGRLGVGTDDPTETLDVEGSMKVGAGGTPFLEIRELTGAISGTSTEVSLPSGYGTTNTRVLCLEVTRLNGRTYGPGVHGIYYRLWGSTLTIYHEITEGTYRVLLMKMP
jgi:hypothetical protein